MNTQTMIYAGIAILLFGIIMGGQIILTLTKYIAQMLRQDRPMSYYGEENYPHRTSGCGSTFLLLLAAGAIIFMAYRSKPIQALLAEPNRNNRSEQGSTPKYSQQSGNVPEQKIYANTEVEQEINHIEQEHDSPDPTPHILQMNTHDEWTDAEMQMRYFAQYQLKTGYYTEETDNGDVVFRVFLGAYNSLTDAYKIKANLGFEQAIIVPAENLNLVYYAEM
jgi:hypothetical protein